MKYDINTCEQVNEYNLTAIHLGPCLAYNADRYGSKNRLREKIEWLDTNYLCQGDTIIVSLGEIDIRTQVYKRVNPGEVKNYKTVVDDVLFHYSNMLRMLKGQGYRVICYGPIGSMKDGTPYEYGPREGSEAQRNAAGRYYNERLEQICKDEGLEFFTLFYDMVSENDLTDSRFLSDDKLHLGQYGYPLAIQKLKALGVEI